MSAQNVTEQCRRERVERLPWDRLVALAEGRETHAVDRAMRRLARAEINRRAALR